MRWLVLLCVSISLWAETLNDDLPLSSATYLGSQGVDRVIGVAFTPAQELVLAGNFAASFLPAGTTFIPLDGKGEGCLLRLSGDGRDAFSLTRFNESIVAFAASDFGFAVALEQSLLLLNTNGDALIYGGINFAAKRVDLSADGHLVALSDTNEIRLFSPTGQLLSSQTFSEFTRLDDAAITPQGNIVFTGYNQLNANLKSPVLECHTSDLTTRLWKAYGFSNTQVTGANLGADSEGERIAMGADGMLYFSGATDGGNTVFQRQPDDINTSLPGGSDPNQNTLIFNDNFNRPVSLSGSAKFSFYARFDPVTGSISKAQFLLARLSSGNQNTIRVRELTADTAGNVLLVGRAFADIEARDQRTVAGQPVGSYAGGNMFALVVEATFANRIYWTSFNGPTPGQSEGFGVATSGDIRQLSGNYAFAGDVFADSNDTSMVITSALQPTTSGDREVYLAVQGTTFASLVGEWPNAIDVRDLISRIGSNSQGFTTSP